MSQRCIPSFQKCVQFSNFRDFRSREFRQPPLQAVGMLNTHRDYISKHRRCAANPEARQLEECNAPGRRSSRLWRGYRGQLVEVPRSAAAPHRACQRPAAHVTSPSHAGLRSGLGTSPCQGEAGSRLQTAPNPRSSSIFLFCKKKYGVYTAVNWIFKSCITKLTTV